MTRESLCWGRSSPLRPLTWTCLALSLLTMASTVRGQALEPGLVRDDPLNYCKTTIIDEVFVPAEEAGVLDELHVREGMLVEKGSLLGKIDDTDARLAHAMAAKEYEAAEKQAKNRLNIDASKKSQLVAQAEYDGALEANEKAADTVTKTEVRRKKFQAEVAEMKIDMAIHELEIAVLDAHVKAKQAERAKAALERRKIISRINGIVVELKKHAGDWVNPGETVMRIVRMDQLRVEGDIDGTKYAWHEIVGRPVDIEVQLTGGGVEKLEGVIAFASSLVESNEYTVRAEVDNRKVNGRWLLTPGLNARMRLRDATVNRLSDN